MYKIHLLDTAKEFLDSLEYKIQAKVLRTLDLLQQFGAQLPMPHSKKLSGYNLFELRIKQASNIVRMFYFHSEGKIYVITSGYVKKTNKTSRIEIERAEKLRDNFLKGQKNDQHKL